MKKNVVLLPTLLVLVVFVATAACMLVPVWLPAANLPTLNIPSMVVLSVMALVLEHLFIGRTKRNYAVIFVFGALAFGVLPLMAGLACVHTFWRFAIAGAVVVTVTSFLFTSAVQRIASGKKAVAAVLMLGIGMCLAAQCFAGVLI